MDDNRLTEAEFATLASFRRACGSGDIDPAHFAKLLSLALVEQKEGGAELTASGRNRLALGAHPRPEIS